MCRRMPSRYGRCLVTTYYSMDYGLCDARRLYRCVFVLWSTNKSAKSKFLLDLSSRLPVPASGSATA